MKIRSFTIRNIEEALDQYRTTPGFEYKGPGHSFLEVLKSTKPGERENIVLQTIEP